MSEEISFVEVLMIQYESGDKESYNQEFDSEWYLIGLVEPKKVHLMLNGGK